MFQNKISKNVTKNKMQKGHIHQFPSLIPKLLELIIIFSRYSEAELSRYLQTVSLITYEYSLKKVQKTYPKPAFP